MRLIDDITVFLGGQGIDCNHNIHHGFDVICAMVQDGSQPRMILPLEICAESEEEALNTSEAARKCADSLGMDGPVPIIITEDRWNSQKMMTQARLLAHLEIFSQAFARNCEVRRIEKSEAQDFLNANHSYGYAACRYHYGLYLKRHTGHLARIQDGSVAPGTLVAVATFSNARKWVKGEKIIRSYEWTRFASLPGMRISGGMGKMLKAFIEDVNPDDIMSYADLEWSRGDVYKALGFIEEERKAPVMFAVDPDTWKRTPVRTEVNEGKLFFRNFGSNKYRLKLTDYE